MRRLILLISVGWLPPYLPPSGACLCLGSSVLIQASERCRGLHHTGAASLPMHVGKPSAFVVESALSVGRMVLWEPLWQWPTCSQPAHAQWLRSRHWRVCLVTRGAGTVYRASLGLSN